MLLKFTDDFVNTIENGKILLGDIQFNIAHKEPFLGNAKVLDKLYAQGIIISGIIDYLENSDNSNPREDESLLLCLRSALDKNICRRFHNKTKDKTNFHKNLITVPAPILPDIPDVPGTSIPAPTPDLPSYLPPPIISPVVVVTPDNDPEVWEEPVTPVVEKPVVIDSTEFERNSTGEDAGSYTKSLYE
jgi:hypothetical protein